VKLSERERRVLRRVGYHSHLSELAIGTACTPPQDRWDEARRLNLGRAVARSLQGRGLLEPSTSPGYWRLAPGYCREVPK
jgi:hypothetical protein